MLTLLKFIEYWKMVLKSQSVDNLSTSLVKVQATTNDVCNLVYCFTLR